MKREISPKIWLPVIGVVLIAVGLAVFFTWPREEKPSEIVTPKVTPEEVTPEISADWKTYKNEEYGFEVSYPERYEFIQGSPALDQNVFYLDIGPVYENNIFIIIYDKSEIATPSEEGVRSEIIVDNEKGIKYEYEFEHSGFERGIEVEPHMDKVVTIYVAKGEKIYQFSLKHSADYKEAFEIFGKMITSFKFLD